MTDDITIKIIICVLTLALFSAIFFWIRMCMRYDRTLEAYRNLSLSHETLKRSVKDIPLPFMPDRKEDMSPPVCRTFRVFRLSTAPPTDLYCPQEFIVAAESADAAVLICMNHFELDNWWTSELIPDSPQIITVVEKF